MNHTNLWRIIIKCTKYKKSGCIFCLMCCTSFSAQCCDIWGVLLPKAGTSNYIPQYLWDVITCPCPWYLLLTQHSCHGHCYWEGKIKIRFHVFSFKIMCSIIGWLYIISKLETWHLASGSVQCNQEFKLDL